MSCYATTLVKDGTVTTSDFGDLKGNGELFLVTGAGRYVKIYLLNQYNSLDEQAAFPLAAEVVSVKFVRIPGEAHESIAVLTSEGSLYKIQYSVDHQRIEMELFDIAIRVPVSNATVDYIPEAGIVAVVSTTHHVTYINMGTQQCYNVKTSTKYAKAITIVSENCLAVMESNNGECSLKVFEFKVVDEVIEEGHHVDEAMEPDDLGGMSDDDSIRTIGDEEMGQVDGDITNEPMGDDDFLPIEIFNHPLPTQCTTMFKVSGPAEGLLIFSDKKVTHIPIPLIHSEFTNQQISEWNHLMTDVTSYTKKSDNEYLIGSGRRDIFLVTIVISLLDEVETLRVHSIGRGPRSSTLSLRNGYLFAGSSVDNSTLLILMDATTDEGNHTYTLNAIQSFENLGPIRDMVIAKDHNGLKIITLSGQGVDCSIRVLQDAVALNPTHKAGIDSPEKMFVLRMGSTYDTWILTSSSSSTLLFGVAPEGFNLNEELPFFSRESTLLAADVSRFVVQITCNFIRLLFPTEQFVSEQRLIIWRHVDTSTPCATVALIVPDRQVILIAAKSVLISYQILMEADQITPSLNRLKSLSLRSIIMCMAHLAKTDNGTIKDYVMIGRKMGNAIIVVDVENMTQVGSVPFPANSGVPNSIIVKGTDLLFSTSIGAYHNEKFNLANMTSGSFEKVPNCNHSVNFCNINTQQPGLAGCSPDGGFLVEKYRGISRYPKLPRVKMIAPFQGSQLVNHLVTIDHDSISVSTMWRGNRKFAAGEHLSALAIEESHNFGVLTHRIDYVNAEQNVKSLSRSIVWEERFSLSRNTNRNTQSDNLFDKKEAKAISSAVFLTTKNFQPKCVVEFGRYECCKLIANGKFLNYGINCYAVVTELGYPGKEVYGTLYIFSVILGETPQVNFHARDEIKTPGEAIFLQFDDGWLFATFGSHHYRYRLNELKQLCVESLNNTESSVVQGSTIQIAASSTSEDLLKGDQCCPVMKLATGSTSNVKATSCLSRTHIIGIGTGKQLTVMYTNRQYQPQIAMGGPLTFDGNFHLGCIPSSIKMTTQLSERMQETLTTGNQLTYTTETGSIGVIVRIEKQWAYLLRRVCHAIATSEIFGHHNSLYKPLFSRRHTNTEFVDGDMIELMLRMEPADIMTILQNVRLENGDGDLRVVGPDSLHNKLLQFTNALSITYMRSAQQ